MDTNKKEKEPRIGRMARIDECPDGASRQQFICVYSWLNARVACTAAARAGRMQFSNHNLNKSRGGKVECLVNLFEQL
jgi:hypothetical protein